MGNTFTIFMTLMVEFVGFDLLNLDALTFNVWVIFVSTHSSMGLVILNSICYKYYSLCGVLASYYSSIVMIVRVSFWVPYLRCYKTLVASSFIVVHCIRNTKYFPSFYI